MSTFTSALTPIALLILGGYLLKRIAFLPEQTWPGIEKITYYVLFPALLVATLGKQNISGTPWPAMLLVVAGTLFISAAVLILWHRISSSVSDPSFTSIFQGGIRFNTYIALALAQAYFGPEGLALGSLAAGFLIVLINLLCIAAFSRWGKISKSDTSSMLREITYNPLIVACGIGWVFSISDFPVPSVLQNSLELIGRAALPLGLLAVGAALQPRLLGAHLRPLIVSSSAQFLLKPIAASLLISVTGLHGVAAGVLFISFMTPTASSAYILARQLGGDTKSMASIITLQTLLAFFIMPVIAMIFL